LSVRLADVEQLATLLVSIVHRELAWRVSQRLTARHVR